MLNFENVTSALGMIHISRPLKGDGEGAKVNMRSCQW